MMIIMAGVPNPVSINRYERQRKGKVRGKRNTKTTDAAQPGLNKRRGLRLSMLKIEREVVTEIGGASVVLFKGGNRGLWRADVIGARGKSR